MTDVSHVHLPADEEEARSPILVRKREVAPEAWERFERNVAEMFEA